MVVLSRRIYRRRHEKPQGNSCAGHCLRCAELADGSVIALVLSGSWSALPPSLSKRVTGLRGWPLRMGYRASLATI
jgi:hypothetical protein